MHPDLENIVNSLLSKGEITERSRELLMKKAEQLGVDAIDFELDLEGSRLHTSELGGVGVNLSEARNH